jgi:peptidoglycan/xylan/chitin deacetylase (PgdA/CDA1 family)
MNQGSRALLWSRGILFLFSLTCAHLIISDSHAQEKSGENASAVVKTNDGARSLTISEGETHDWRGRPMIALTFDDGPHPTLTPQLLDILNAHQAKATFYVVGKQVDNFPQIAQRIAREGHEIGNHTHSHKDLRKLGTNEINAEISKAESSINKAAGVRTYSIRPPYGALNKRVISALPPSSHPIVLWTVDPLDWKKPGAQEVARRLLGGARPGAILLCHDIHRDTIEAMRSVVPDLLDQGYKLVTVSEILSKRQTVDLDHED